MSEPTRSPVNPLARALGKIPSGLYILTARRGERATGMLASWVQQAGFDPPMITVAVGTQRFVADWLAESGRFSLNQLPKDSKALIKHFGHGFSPDADAFEGFALRPEGQGGPVLEAAIAYLDMQVVGEFASGDHRIFVGQVLAGAVFEEAEPLVHVRGSGLHY